MHHDREAVLEAFGFEKVGDIWRFEQKIKEGGRLETAIVIVKENDDGTLTGKIPVRSKNDSGFEGEGLYYSSADVADMIALAQNEISSVTLEVTGYVVEDGFEDDGVWIAHPFNNDPWGDYGISSRIELSDGSHKMILRNPQEMFAGYDQWKHEFVDQIMNKAAPKP